VVLRGVHSDLLSIDLAAVMRKRSRMINLFQFDDSGHVPPLMAPEQIDVVNRLLLDDASSGAEKRGGSRAKLVACADWLAILS
jgi:hypothetical protein